MANVQGLTLTIYETVPLGVTAEVLNSMEAPGPGSKPTLDPFAWNTSHAWLPILVESDKKVEVVTVKLGSSLCGSLLRVEGWPSGNSTSDGVLCRVVEGPEGWFVTVGVHVKEEGEVPLSFVDGLVQYDSLPPVSGFLGRRDGSSGLTEEGEYGSSMCVLGDPYTLGVRFVLVGDPGLEKLELFGLSDTSSSISSVSPWLSLPTSSSPTYFPKSAVSSGSQFGASMTASAADIDYDGVAAEVAVGAPSDDTGGSDRGAVYVLFFEVDMSVKAYTKIGAGMGGMYSTALGNGGLFGTAMAWIDGDQEGMSRVLAVGCIKDTATNIRAGTVLLLRLNPDGNVDSVSRIVTGSNTLIPFTTSSSKFGSAIAPLGDIDGDGAQDLCATAIGYEDDGAAFVLLLDQNIQSVQHVRTHLPPGNYRDYGEAVATLGDLDGDGITELLVGAPRDQYASILYLSTTGEAKATFHLIPGTDNIPSVDANIFWGSSFAMLWRGRLLVGARDAASIGQGSIFLYGLNPHAPVPTKLFAVSSVLSTPPTPSTAPSIPLTTFSEPQDTVVNIPPRRTSSSTSSSLLFRVGWTTRYVTKVSITIADRPCQRSYVLEGVVDPGLSPRIAYVVCEGLPSVPAGRRLALSIIPTDPLVAIWDDDAYISFDTYNSPIRSYDVLQATSVASISKPSSGSGAMGSLFGYASVILPEQREGMVDVVVGAPLDDDVQTDGGALYLVSVAKKTEQSTTQKISGLQGVIGAGARMGISLAVLDQSTIAVGGRAEPSLNSVFLLEIDVTVPEVLVLGEISASSSIHMSSYQLGAVGSSFGSSIACLSTPYSEFPQGYTLVVGEPGHDGTAVDSGALVWMRVSRDGTVVSLQPWTTSYQFALPFELFEPFGNFGSSLTTLNSTAVVVGIPRLGEGGIAVISCDESGTVVATTVIRQGTKSMPMFLAPSQLGIDVSNWGDIDGSGGVTLAISSPYIPGIRGLGSGGFWIVRFNTTWDVESVTRIASGFGGLPADSGIVNLGRSLTTLVDATESGIADTMFVGCMYCDDDGSMYKIQISDAVTSPTQPSLTPTRYVSQSLQPPFSIPFLTRTKLDPLRETQNRALPVAAVIPSIEFPIGSGTTTVDYFNSTLIGAWIDGLPCGNVHWVKDWFSTTGGGGRVGLTCEHPPLGKQGRAADLEVKTTSHTIIAKDAVEFDSLPLVEGATLLAEGSGVVPSGGDFGASSITLGHPRKMLIAAPMAGTRTFGLSSVGSIFSVRFNSLGEASGELDLLYGFDASTDEMFAGTGEFVDGGDTIGESMTYVGDLDGDGLAQEVIVGAPRLGSEGIGYLFVMWVIEVVDGDMNEMLQVNGSQKLSLEESSPATISTSFGSAVAHVPTHAFATADVVIAVGSPWASGGGMVQFFAISPGTFLLRHLHTLDSGASILNISPLDHFGSSIAAHPSQTYVAIGSPRHNSQAGRVHVIRAYFGYLLYGSVGDVVDDWMGPGVSAKASLGSSLAWLPDLDGDGHERELAIGAPGYESESEAGDERGAVFVVTFSDDMKVVLAQVILPKDVSPYLGDVDVFIQFGSSVSNLGLQQTRGLSGEIGIGSIAGFVIVEMRDVATAPKYPTCNVFRTNPSTGDVGEVCQGIDGCKIAPGDSLQLALRTDVVDAATEIGNAMISVPYLYFFSTFGDIFCVSRSDPISPLFGFPRTSGRTAAKIQCTGIVAVPYFEEGDITIPTGPLQVTRTYLKYDALQDDVETTRNREYEDNYISSVVDDTYMMVDESIWDTALYPQWSIESVLPEYSESGKPYHIFVRLRDFMGQEASGDELITVLSSRFSGTVLEDFVYVTKSHTVEWMAELGAVFVTEVNMTVHPCGTRMTATRVRLQTDFVNRNIDLPPKRLPTIQSAYILGAPEETNLAREGGDRIRIVGKHFGTWNLTDPLHPIHAQCDSVWRGWIAPATRANSITSYPTGILFWAYVGLNPCLDVVWVSPEAVDCVVPPGYGANLPISLTREGSLVTLPSSNLSYTPFEPLRLISLTASGNFSNHLDEKLPQSGGTKLYFKSLDLIPYITYIFGQEIVLPEGSLPSTPMIDTVFIGGYKTSVGMPPLQELGVFPVFVPQGAGTNLSVQVCATYRGDWNEDEDDFGTYTGVSSALMTELGIDGLLHCTAMDESVAVVNYEDPILLSITPNVDLDPLGGDVLTLLGSGFSSPSVLTSGGKKVQVWLGERECLGVVHLSSGSLSCTTPPLSSIQATVHVRVEIDGSVSNQVPVSVLLVSVVGLVPQNVLPAAPGRVKNDFIATVIGIDEVAAIVIGGQRCDKPIRVSEEALKCIGVPSPTRWETDDVWLEIKGRGDKQVSRRPLLRSEPPPEIFAIDLSKGAPTSGGTQVDIVGNGFGLSFIDLLGVIVGGGDEMVALEREEGYASAEEGLRAPSNWTSRNRISFTLPPGVGSRVPVRVVLTTGLSSPPFYFSYASPTLTSITPQLLLPGWHDAQVTLCGSNLARSGNDSVQIVLGGVECKEWEVTTPSKCMQCINLQTPPLTGQAEWDAGGDVVVVVEGLEVTVGIATLSGTFVPPPKVTEASPTVVSEGTQVVLRGEGIGVRKGYAVGVDVGWEISRRRVEDVTWSAERPEDLIVTMPLGVGEGVPLRVVVETGLSSSPIFVSYRRPEITSVSPLILLPGLKNVTVTIRGDGFSALQSSMGPATVGGIPCGKAVAVSASEMRCEGLDTPQFGETWLDDVVVVTVGNQTSLRTVIPGLSLIPPPKIERVAPTQAGRGDIVTILGDGFGASADNVAAVEIGGVACANVEWISSSQVRCTIPESHPAWTESDDDTVVPYLGFRVRLVSGIASSEGDGGDGEEESEGRILPIGLRHRPSPSIEVLGIAAWRPIGQSGTVNVRWRFPGPMLEAKLNAESAPLTAIVTHFELQVGSSKSAVNSYLRDATLTRSAQPVADDTDPDAYEWHNARLPVFEDTPLAVRVRVSNDDGQGAWAALKQGWYRPLGGVVPETCSELEYLASTLPSEDVVCLDCPTGAICAGLAAENVTARPGYWRVPWAGLGFSSCPVPSACLGTLSATEDATSSSSSSSSSSTSRLLSSSNSSRATLEAGWAVIDEEDRPVPLTGAALVPGDYEGCATGHRGVLCAACLPGFFPGANDECESCGDRLWIAMRLFLLITAILAALVVLLIRSWLTRSQHYDEIALSKIVLTHAQTIAIVGAVQLRWPDGAKEFFSVIDVGSSFTTSGLALECLLGGASQSPFLRTLVILVMPIGLLGFSALFWWAMGHCERHFRCTRRLLGTDTGPEDREMLGTAPATIAIPKKARRNRRPTILDELPKLTATIKHHPSLWNDRMLISVLVIAFLVHTPLTSAAFRLLTCRPVSPDDDPTSSELHLSMDMDVRCSDPEQLTWMLAIAIPMLALISLGIPITAALYLRSIGATELQNDWWRERLGWLYSGFRSKYYYWESVILLRKVLLAFVTTVLAPSGGGMQVVTGLVVVLVSLVFHVRSHPYSNTLVNAIESSALVTSALTLVGGIYVVLDDAGEGTGDLGIIASVLIVSVNVLFVGLALVLLSRTARVWVTRAVTDLRDRWDEVMLERGVKHLATKGSERRLLPTGPSVAVFGEEGFELSNPLAKVDRNKKGFGTKRRG